MRRLLLFILTFGGQALAALPNDVICSSLLGPNKVAKIPTSTVSVTQNITVTKKIVLKVQRVVLGPAKTITSTSTSTSTSTTIADPATKTATVFESKAEWVTETRYATSTVITEEVKTVTDSSMTTIFPSPGFQSAKQVPGYVPKVKVRDAPAKIVGLPKNMQVVRVKGIPGNQKVVAVPEQYVQRVDCTKKVRSSFTVTTKVTVTASNIYPPPTTKTKMVTVTETQTSTVYPADATTTITSTDTATFTTTTTIVTSTTKTIECEPRIPGGTDNQNNSRVAIAATVEITVPVPYYAACMNDNLVATANGGSSIIEMTLPGTTIQIGRSDQYNCCAECNKRTDCTGSFFEGMSQICKIVLTDSCTPQAAELGYRTGVDRTTYKYFYISNGPCGKWVNGGAIPDSGDSGKNCFTIGNSPIKYCI